MNVNTPPVAASSTRVPLTTRCARLAMILTMLGLAAVLAPAQDKTEAAKLPDAPSQTAQTQKTSGTADTGNGFVDLLSRTSFFFPNLATSDKPLTSGGKFKLFVANSVSGGAFFGAATGAAFGQAFNSPEGYGQGGEGYAKRFGASMATNASSQFFGTWLLASALHQDPRFFVKPTSDIKVAVRTAVRRTFITRDDRTMKPVANWSGLLGPLLAEGLANAYMPPDAQTVGKTFQRYGTDIGVTAGTNVLRQFWPSIMRGLRLSKQPTTTVPDPDPTTAPATKKN